MRSLIILAVLFFVAVTGFFCSSPDAEKSKTQLALELDRDWFQGLSDEAREERADRELRRLWGRLDVAEKKATDAFVDTVNYEQIKEAMKMQSSITDSIFALRHLVKEVW